MLDLWSLFRLELLVAVVTGTALLLARWSRLGASAPRQSLLTAALLAALVLPFAHFAVPSWQLEVPLPRGWTAPAAPAQDLTSSHPFARAALEASVQPGG